MARYQIWDKQSDIITPSGAQFTAQEWADHWPWVKAPGAKMVITAGPINGGCAEYFDSFVEIRKRQGAAITDGMTDEEILAAIEDFENTPPGAGEPGPEERIAAALEAQVMLAEPEAVSAFSSRGLGAVSEEGASSAACARVKRNYERGLWSAAMVQVAAEKGHITPDEAAGILASE